VGLFKKDEPVPMNIAGIQLQCEICKHDHFFSREALLNTPAMTLLDLDWMNKAATCAVCANCGYVHWFLPL
jgi:predicted nucleic-acid-binding Zn-ribbon protein